MIHRKDEQCAICTQMKIEIRDPANRSLIGGGGFEKYMEQYFAAIEAALDDAVSAHLGTDEWTYDDIEGRVSTKHNKATNEVVYMIDGVEVLTGRGPTAHRREVPGRKDKYVFRHELVRH